MATVATLLARKPSDVYAIGPTDSVLDAARLMNARHIGGLVVLTSDRHLVGMFTERDILTRVVARQLDPATTRVEEVMTTPVAVCRRETPVEECRAAMTARRIRHLPVVDGERLVGILTTGDILAHEVSEQGSTIEFLSEYLFGGR
ncbi:MAG: CBS domain-containing protein [Vicinamibacterales bacterium]